jgi:Ig-like domain from next to BRCA1 gene
LNKIPERKKMIQKSRSPYILITIVVMLVLSACGSPDAAAPTLDMNLIFTQVAETIAVQYTQTALAVPPPTNTPEPTLTPLPSPTLSQPLILATSTLAALPTSNVAVYVSPTSSTAYDCYDAALVADVTIPDGTKFDPGNTFEKTWQLKNTGTCDWTVDFKLAHVGGDLFGSDTTKIRQKIFAGNTMEFTLPMVAPNSAGAVYSNWQMETDTGHLFGPVLTVSIKLPGTNTTPTVNGCYDASLVSDVTIPDGYEVSPKQGFTKTWEIQNSGTCDWNKDFKITFVGGNVMGSDTTKIRKNVEAGDTTRISLDMVAPNKTGSVTGSWQMADDSGNLFGQIITVEIVVK